MFNKLWKFNESTFLLASDICWELCFCCIHPFFYRLADHWSSSVCHFILSHGFKCIRVIHGIWGNVGHCAHLMLPKAKVKFEPQIPSMMVDRLTRHVFHIPNSAETGNPFSIPQTSMNVKKPRNHWSIYINPPTNTLKSNHTRNESQKVPDDIISIS